MVWWTVARRMDDDGSDERKNSLSLVAHDHDVNDVNTNGTTDNIILAPFNPTCDHAQQVALQMLLGQDSENHGQKAHTNVILFDLGCGDGRLLLRAVQCCSTVRCVGIERDPALVNKALDAIHAQLTDEQQSRIEIRSGDALKPDNAVVAVPQTTPSMIVGDSTETSTLSTIGSKCQDLRLQDATALYLYLLPKGLIHIQQQLLTRENMPQLSAVVTYMFRFKQWEPVRVDRSTKAMVPMYLYKVD